MSRAQVQDLLDGKCPDCGRRLFLAGPEGGLTQNVQCADCGARFNFCPRCAALPSGFVERISAPPAICWCPRCDIGWTEAELLDGETCPQCKLVL